VSDLHPRDFWAGQFGNEYIDRNVSDQLFASNLHFFSNILESCEDISSIMELGANVGMNIKALRMLSPDSKLHGVEINRGAFDELSKLDCNAHNSAIEDFSIDETFDLVFTKGVLIHIAPENLESVYSKMYKLSKKYILVGEYYNPSPVELTYRGNEGKLFKRDFAGDLLDKFSNLKLVDYGFAYKRGPFPQDDITWFLMEKI
jgi:pseudaminic acid biosynthesis-associated methylase